MKKILQTPNQLPAWQRERAMLLEKACTKVKARIARGKGLLRSIRIVARNLHGKPFKSDPARRLKLKFKTLVSLFYAWRASGENASVFQLHFVCRHSLFNNLVIARFADFLLAHPQCSIERNWKIFSSRRSNFRGKWRAPKKAIQAAIGKSPEIESRVRAALTPSN